MGEAPAKAWFAQYVLPIGQDYALGVRYDMFDPDTRNRLHPACDGEVKK